MQSSRTVEAPRSHHTREDLRHSRARVEETSDLFVQPSSSTAGFFQSPPQVLNQFYDDAALQRAIAMFLPSSVRELVQPELSAFGDKVLSKQVLHWIADAEKNPPYLRTWDTWGKRRDELVTSEGWRCLQDIGIEEGMVAIGYENHYAEHSRVFHFAKYHLWCGSSAWVNCPSLMTDGVASLFRSHLSNPSLPSDQREVLQSAFSRITSRDPKVAWTTGQWMTERQGGSDVSQTETLATYSPETESSAKSSDGNDLGPWVINGFKWFSSATDSSMTVMLARTPKGISTFFAPMRRTLPGGPDSMGYTTELNGIYIQRLKQKLGTRALPTAELELKGVRAWLIGEEGRGTKEIATVLNIARIHNAVSAVGFWGRGLGISRAFGRCRKVGTKPLHAKTSYLSSLARQHVEYRANVLFTFFVTALLGVVEQKQDALYHQKTAKLPKTTAVIPDSQTAEHLLRLLTPALKGITAKKAISGLQECMESLGGVGYLENEDMQFNIARLYRDANVLSIWEGTTDMMAHDVLRAVQKLGTQALNAVDMWLESIFYGGRLESIFYGGRLLMAEEYIVQGWWGELKAAFTGKTHEELEMRSRDIMNTLSEVVSGALLVADARRDNDDTAEASVHLWFADRRGNCKSNSEEAGSVRTLASQYERIVFGTEEHNQEYARL